MLIVYVLCWKLGLLHCNKKVDFSALLRTTVNKMHHLYHNASYVCACVHIP